MASPMQVTPEQLAELQQSNPMAAKQLMRMLGMPTPADDLNSNGAAVLDNMNWLGADGMPVGMSASGAEAAPASLSAGPSGKQARGVPNAAPTPPLRPASMGAGAGKADTATPTDSTGDTARTNARGGGRSAAPADKKAGPPVGAQSQQRIAAEIFGPPNPADVQGPPMPEQAAPVAAPSMPAEMPPDVAASAASASQVPKDGPLGDGDMTQVPTSTSWKDTIASMFGPDKKMIAMLASAGVDYNQLPTQQRIQLNAMGPQKWLQQYGPKPKAAPTRQQATR